jgi:hypothetical protein
MEGKELTFGQRHAGVSFNPSALPLVDAIKNKSAELLDLLNDAREATSNKEAKDYLSDAIMRVVDGQMKAVKAVTWE